MWCLVTMALGLMLVKPWAPAAQEQEQPKKAEEQTQQPKAPEAPAASEPQQPQKAEEPSQQPKPPEVPSVLAPPLALDLPPGVPCNKPPAAQAAGNPKKLNPCMEIPEVLPEGRTIWMATGCPGCHGMGGGGMCPSTMDDEWKFGGDDETLFKLIKGTYPKQTMPAVFGLLLKDEQIWKIIAWIRSIYKGDPSMIVW